MRGGEEGAGVLKLIIGDHSLAHYVVVHKHTTYMVNLKDQWIYIKWHLLNAVPCSNVLFISV